MSRAICYKNKTILVLKLILHQNVLDFKLYVIPRLGNNKIYIV